MEWQTFSAALRRFSAPDQARIERAFRLGEKAHGTQKRRSGELYFVHPSAVARILIDWRADADTVIAALLHDTVEDTPLTLDDIAREFGRAVRTLVEGVTKLTREELENHPTLNEQIETLRKMFSLMQEDVRIMVIKLADRLHNMHTVRFLPPEKQLALARETLEVYVRIAERLCMYALEQELEALCTDILEPELSGRLSILKEESDGRAEHIAADMRATLREDDPDMLRTAEIVPEQKSWRRLRQQLKHEGAVATGVSVITVVFVCPDVDTCYRVFGALHQLWKRETLSFQDFINSPQINGYRGLHTTIILTDGTRVRCKIRTQEMNRYAHDGITTLCFDPSRPAGSGKGFLESLPWARRISPLAEDTKDRSKEFWESLQSDILGESIVLHGPGDETVMIPKGATALDGSFYLFKNEAVRTQAIKLNGLDSPFQAALKHGDSLSVTFAPKPTVQREWLQWTKTGLATARIRTAISQMQTPTEKLEQGAQLFRRIMDERKKGYIEEFNVESVNRILATMGYRSMDEVYRALADGKIEARDVYAALFEPSPETPSGLRHSYTMQYTINMDDTGLMDRVAQVHRSFRAFVREIRYRQPGAVTLKLSVDDKQLRQLMQELHGAGARNIETIPQRTGLHIIASSIALFVLWGLDPVIAHLILTRLMVSPLDLTFIRFLSLSVMSGLLFLMTKRGSTLPQARLTLRSTSLWFSVVLFFAIALSTYLSLSVTRPSHYTIPMTAAGIILTSVVTRPPRGTLLMTWVLFAAGVAVLLFATPFWSWMGVLYTACAVIAFAAFWIISERYRRRQKVFYRNIQFFFILSLLCTLMTLPFVPFLSLAALSAATLARTVLFCIVFIGLPYCIAYTMPHAAVRISSRFSFIVILTTATAQAVFAEAVHSSAIVGGALVLLGGLLLAMRNEGVR